MRCACSVSWRPWLLLQTANSLSTLGRFFSGVCPAVLPLSPQVGFTCPPKSAVTACCRVSSYLILADLAVCIHKCAQKPDLSSLLLNFAAHIWFVTLCASSSPGTCCVSQMSATILRWQSHLISIQLYPASTSAQAQAWCWDDGCCWEACLGLLIRSGPKGSYTFCFLSMRSFSSATHWHAFSGGLAHKTSDTSSIHLAWKINENPWMAKDSRKVKILCNLFCMCILCMWMYVFMFIHMGAHVCEGTCVFSVYACEYICMLCTCMFTCVGSHVCVNVYICGGLCVDVCKHVYGCICI